MAWPRRRVIASALAAAALGAGPARADDSGFVGSPLAGSRGPTIPIGSLIASVLSSPPGARPCGEAGGCGVPNLILVAETSNGSVANVESIATGAIATGFAQSDVAYGAFSGTGVFAGREPVGKLRALASLYLESMHLVVTAISGITRVAGSARPARVPRRRRLGHADRRAGCARGLWSLACRLHGRPCPPGSGDRPDDRGASSTHCSSSRAIPRRR